MIEVSELKNQLQTNMFEGLSEHNHEQILVCNDTQTGLKALIAIHNTTLGPGLGGTRMWMYHNEAEAVRDVLRLSRGMTYKASISGLNLGGAKAVIIGDSHHDKSEALMRRFGRFVNNLGGKYITAEDVGTTTKDMEYVNMETDHVVGLPESRGGGGDPSPVTAYGVYVGIKASAKRKWGTESLTGKKIAVMGIGKVGMHLLEYLHKDGVRFYVSDMNEDALNEAANRYGAQVVTGDEIFDTDAEIFAPCALGGIVNSETIDRLKCEIIAGAANNQLEDEDIHGPMLTDKGILYAPDFLINAGGLINVYSEYTGYHRENAIRDTERIYETLSSIYKLSDEEGIHTQAAATKLAEKRIHDIMLVKSRI
ncbi:MAG: leucine dehydrogenase [Bacteroidetes bacterium]|nr:leucine dehydrogenase [Bacteroidota bacterium]